jgi:hypothetical protein
MSYLTPASEAHLVGPYQTSELSRLGLRCSHVGWCCWPHRSEASARSTPLPTAATMVHGGGDPRPGLSPPPTGDPPTPSDPAAILIKHPLPQWGTPLTRLCCGSFADGMHRDPLIRSLVDLVEIWPLCCNQIILYNNPRVYTGLYYIIIAARQLGTGMGPAGCCDDKTLKLPATTIIYDFVDA